MIYKILVVDDEAANLRLLERLFRREYQVFTAASGGDALELLRTHDFAVIISDQRMPGMTGIEFLKRASEMRPHTVRIILTGYTDVNALVEAINSGVVYKYVTKPWVNEDLQQTVVRALEHYETIKSRYELTVQNARLNGQLSRMQQIFIRLVGDFIRLKDVFLHERSQRVSGYAAALGQRLNLAETELEPLALAAFLHAVGHIGVPDDVLRKADALSDEEFQIVRRSAERGALMLGNLPEMSEIAGAVRYHTEHFDGTGFPEHLAGEQIPFFSRIIAVAVAYDEMTEPRDRTAALTHEKAVARLRAEAGKQFDAAVVEAFGEIHSIETIQQALSAETVGENGSGRQISGGAANMSTGEILQQFKTEPLLALNVLRIGNQASDAAPTARLMPLMSKIGEAKLRSILERHGLPSADRSAEPSATHAARRAAAAQMLAAHTAVINPDDAYTLGLLRDVGETLLFKLFPSQMLAAENPDAAIRAQRQTAFCGIDAAQISRRMLESCGVPRALTAAIENQPDFMHVNDPLALLMEIAGKIADTTAADKTVRLNTVESSVLETLNLCRADLNKICDRAHFISEGQVETPDEASEPAR